MTKRTTISIPKRYEPLWNAWVNHPANKNTSAALLRLIRDDLRTRRVE